MCVVSMVGDGWGKQFPDRFPSYPEVTRAEFLLLKKEVEALKELLKAANKFDEETNQQDCHMDEKVRLIKEVARTVGVDISDVLPPTKDGV